MKSEPVNVIPEIETNPVVFQQKEPEKKWKTVVKKYANRYFIDAFSGMAQGLFVTLIAGTIFKQIGSWCGANSGFGALLILIGNIACTLMGAGIGVGIAKKLKAPDLVVFACAVAGFLGAFLPDKVYNLLSDGSFSLKAVAGSITAFKVGAPGNPIGSYVSTLIALEIVLLVQGKTKLDILNKENKVSRKRNPIETIKSRIKSPDSIAKKLEKKHLPVTFESMMTNLNDIAGVRVICPYISDIYSVREMLLKQPDITLIHESDYISEPKQSGYRSLHLVIEVPVYLSKTEHNVRVEIQLRTIAMDFWASLEHELHYKNDADVPDSIRRELFRVAETIAMTDREMEEIALELQALD